MNKRFFGLLIWAALPASFAIGFLVFFWLERRELFRRLPYSLLDDDNGLPMVWSVAAVVLLLFQVRKAAASRVVWSVRVAILALTLLALLSLLAGKNSWVRYHVYRWECFHQHLGITAVSRNDADLELVQLLTDEAIGQWMHRDRDMLLHLAIKRSDLFARRPCEANLALSSLIRSGTTVAELQSQPDAQTFVLYALAGDVYPVPNKELNWLQRGADGARSGFGSGLVSKTAAASLIQSKVDALETLPAEELEAVLFCVAGFRDLVDDAECERVLQAWLEQVPEFSGLLAEGYGLGDMLSESLTREKVARVCLSVDEGYVLPVEASRKQVLLTLPRSLQALLRLKSDHPIQFVPSGDADIELELKIDGDKLYEYQRQVYEWRKTYKRGSFRSSGRNRMYQPGRTISEQVATGTTTVETVYGATIQLNAPFSDEPVEIAETLAYWQDYLRSGQKEAGLESVDYAKLSGRLWPLGIHESYFLGGDMVVKAPAD